MSRRNQRRFQSAQSLMKTRHKPCQYDGCFNVGVGCYDDHAGPITAGYCLEHRAEHGYCYDCGIQAGSERFKTGPGKGFCDACWEAMETAAAWRNEPDDWPDEEIDDDY